MLKTEIEKRVRDGFDKQGFMKSIGASLTKVESGCCHIAVPYTNALTQQHGFFHGGVSATLADNAAGFAGYTLMDDDVQPLSIEFKISFIEAARGEMLEARARVIKNGRRLKFVQVDVVTISEGEEQIVAVALATITSTRSVKLQSSK